MLRLAHGQAAEEPREILDFPAPSALGGGRYVAGRACGPPLLGGDPSAGSPTDTLLRLNLPC